MHKAIHFLSRKEGLFLMLAVLVGGTAIFVSLSRAANTSELLPILDGQDKQWTASVTSASTKHYTLVDESSCNGNTDYVYSTAVGSRDSYAVNLSSIPNGAVINLITVTPCASRHLTGTGSSKMKVFYRNGIDINTHSNEYLFTNGNTPTSLPSRTWNLYSGIVKTSDTKFEIGATYTYGDRGIRLSRIGVSIEYSLPYPSNLTATLSCSAAGTPQVVLNWADNSVDENRFEIMRGTAGSAVLGSLASTDGNIANYSDGTIAANSTYTYQVFSVKDGTNGYRYYSNFVNVSVPASPCGSSVPVTTTTPPVTDMSSSTATSTSSNTSANPLVPTNVTGTLSCSSSGTPQVVLNWKDNTPDESRFQIMRGPVVSYGLSFSHLGYTSGPDILSYTDKTVALGTSYNYQVNADKIPPYGGSGYTYSSSHVTVTIPATSPCTSAPTTTSTPPVTNSTPQALGNPGQAGVVTSSTCAFSAVITWVDNSTSEEGFKVYRQDTPGQSPKVVATTGPNVTKYVDTTVTPGKYYGYYVMAFTGTSGAVGQYQYVTIPTTCQ